MLNPLLALLVVRFASVELWGEFVELLIIVQFGAHIIAWGNREYLLREFSRHPAQIAKLWQTSFLTRSLLAGAFFLVLLFWGLPSHLFWLLIVWTMSAAWYQSNDVFVVYQKDFRFALVVEFGTLVLLVLSVLALGTQITLEHIISLYALAHLLKASVFLYRFRDYTLDKSHLATQQSILRREFDPHYFRLALPFFLLGFSGLLQSRIDLYSVNYFLTDKEVGQYQVFINLMIYLQAIANFILLPFVKNIYRLQYRTIFKLSARLFLFGLIILPPAFLGIHFVLENLYHFNFAPAFYVFGALFVLPIYFYLPIIYALYKANLQTSVLAVNLLGAALTLGLNVLLLPRIGMLGAIISIAIVKWVVWISYLIQSFRIRRIHASAMPELP
ncbi:MAG: hypothetical protein GY805_28680 [Chloroflexi bacterium]|nr:hypothetical protein [Chloroflexota bacterium]